MIMIGDGSAVGCTPCPAQDRASGNRGLIFDRRFGLTKMMQINPQSVVVAS
jgi:hypothetical protein